jgi:hypothetical protein
MYEPPATHEPVAPAAPQPSQLWFTSSRFSVQVSPPAPHNPGVVRHPSVSLHDASQHTLPLPTPQVVGDAAHEQVPHTSSIPLQKRVQLPG